MGLITRFYGPNAKGSKLTIKEMDNNLYYLQSFGVSGVTYQNNVLSLINPTGGTNTVVINDFYTTGATYNNGTIYFNRNDQLSAYTVNISSLTGGTNTPLTVGTTQISNGGNGRILFQSGTTLQQDNSLFWDITNKRLGIGVTSPTTKLDVSGKTKTTNFQMTSGAANGYVLTSDVSGNAFWQLSNSFTGGTVNGPTNFTNGLTANTISATTYQNLPLDVFVTGGTYSDGTITLENNTGGTFNITGITKSLNNEWLIASGDTVEIESFTQKFIYGDLYVLGTLLLNQNSQLIVLNGDIIISGGTISGSGQTVLVDLPTFGDLITSGTYSGGTLTLSTSNGSDVTVNGFFTGTTQTITGNYLALSGGTVTGATSFTDVLEVNAISATTYYNLPLDVTVTGGTFSANTITFTNTTGGTFNVTGVTTTPSVNYTVYKALVSLSGGIFTVRQLENTIGDGSGVSPNDIQWSNPSNGVIRATKTTSFTSPNILISVENINGGGVPYICTGQKSTSNFISIQIFLHDGTLLSTPNFTNLPVEIRIY